MINPATKLLYYKMIGEGGQRDKYDRGHDYYDRNDRNDREYDRGYGVRYDNRMRERRTMPYSINNNKVNDDRDYGYDRYRDGYDRGYSDGLNDSMENMDGAKEIELKAKDISDWEKLMKSKDGTKGFRFDKREIEQVANQMGVRGDDYDMTDIMLVANKLYCDHSETLKNFIPYDQEAHYYVALAKEWLETQENITGGDKVAVYYNLFVKDHGKDQRRR